MLQSTDEKSLVKQKPCKDMRAPERPGQITNLTSWYISVIYSFLALVPALLWKLRNLLVATIAIKEQL